MMRGTPGMRLTMAILSPAFLLLCVVAIYSEETRPWMEYQNEFNALYVTRAKAKLAEAAGRQDAAEQARWQRVVDEVAQAKPEIKQVYLADLKVADHCTTCHRGIDNPLFHDAPQPFRAHPGDALKHHDVNVFGCTLCHQGQGVATTVEAAHGLDHWPTPLLPRAYVQTTCARCHEVTHGLAGADVVTRGTDLFMEKGCYGCHDVKGVDYLPKFGPPLTAVRDKLADAPAWVYAWIKDPAHLSPDTVMPDFKLSDDEAGKITAYLLSFPPGKPAPAVNLDGASAEEGERLFTERGCRGCHAVKAEERSVSPRVPHLAGIGSKVSAAWLDQWLTDPKAYNAETAMPKVELKDEERRAVVAYLLTLKRSEPLPAAPNLGALKPEEGKELVKQYECYGCHAITGFEPARPSVPDLSEFARKPADELDFGATTDVPRTKWDWLKRKLQDPRAYATPQSKLKMPPVNLALDEIDALIASTLAFDRPVLPARYAQPASAPQRAVRTMRWMVAHLNCNGCHRLNARDAHLASFFERKNLVPPTLDGVGARLQGQYLYQFLLEPKPIRPWLKLRMPVFGFADADARRLVEGFAAAEQVDNPYTYVASTVAATESFQRGIRRFRHYKCVQCHPTSIDQGLPPDVDPEDLSINLMLSKSRLRPQWLKDFMARPKQIAGAQTRMPTVFYTVEGEPKVETAQKDIDDITTYLMAMTEPPEVTLKAEEETRAAEKGEENIDWTQYKY
jgi:mono/diheme cytochrome c family protein